MESPRKNNDCYFYYYSTCTKGDTCTFRHEPSALGCETVCSFWKEGKCINVHCSFRHMELRKNRKAIPCYWETQPGGCLKPHCPFLHKSNKNGECESLGVGGLDSTTLSTAISQVASQGIDIDRSSNQYSETKYGNATVVDPLVVKFEEESDNESVPTNSPAKSIQTRVVKVKTLEEIRLEKIQAESAAYYSYPGAEVMIPETPTIAYSVDNAEDLRQRIISRLTEKSEKTPPSIFGTLSRPQGRKRRLQSTDHDNDLFTKKEPYKTQRIIISMKPSQDLGSIKVKTLKEIREERLKKLKQESILNINVNTEEAKQSDGDPCPEVSSTSTEEVVEGPGLVEVPKTIKPTQGLKRNAPCGTNEEFRTKRKPQHLKSNNVPEDVSPQQPIINNEKVEQVQDECINKTEISANNDNQHMISQQSEPNISDTSENKLQYDSNKQDDILLLNDDDIEDSGITFKAEDDILKDLDDLLNN